MMLKKYFDILGSGTTLYGKYETGKGGKQLAGLCPKVI